MGAEHNYLLPSEKLEAAREALRSLSMICGKRFKENSPIDLSSLLTFDYNILCNIGRWCGERVGEMLDNPDYVPEIVEEFPMIAYFLRTGRVSLCRSPDIIVNTLMIALDLTSIPSAGIAYLASWNHNVDPSRDQFFTAAWWASCVIRQKYNWPMVDGSDDLFELPAHVKEWHEKQKGNPVG